MIIRVMMTGLLIQLLVSNSFAQQITNENANIKKYFTYTVDQEVDNVYKASVEKTNLILKSGNKAQLKQNILKTLRKDDDKKYIEQLFSSFGEESLKGLIFSYKQGIFWLKTNDGQTVKIKPAGAFSTKISVNEKLFDITPYTSAKDAIEALAKIIQIAPSNKTVLNYFQSTFLVDKAYAMSLGMAAVLVVFYEIFIAAPIDSELIKSCEKKANFAIKETEKLLDSCKEQLNQIATLDWPITTAGRILASSKTLPFTINAKTVDDITCEKFENNEDRLSAPSTMTFFLVRYPCFEDNTRAQFCDKVEKLQVCVSKSQTERAKNGAVVDAARGGKISTPVSTQPSPINTGAASK